MPNTTYTAIKAILLSKLQAITQIENVTDNPKQQFDGYPAAVIVPSEGESDWETNAEDFRAYAFDIVIYDETQKQGISSAIDNLMDTVDYVLDSISADKRLAGIALPSGKTIITANPVAAGWGSVDDNQLLVAIVKVKVIISVDT